MIRRDSVSACVYITYLSIVGCDDKSPICTGVDCGRKQLLLLPDPNTGPLDHRHTQRLKLGKCNQYGRRSLERKIWSLTTQGAFTLQTFTAMAAM